MSEHVQWCVRCGARFTEEETHSASCCPKCGSTSLPCGTDEDLAIEINWHELRVLTIWATNFAQSIEDGNKGSMATVQAICNRLQQQHPALTPLTLGGEIRELRQKGIGEIDTNIPAEQLVVVHGPGAVGFGYSTNDRP